MSDLVFQGLSFHSHLLEALLTMAEPPSHEEVEAQVTATVTDNRNDYMHQKGKGEEAL